MEKTIFKYEINSNDYCNIIEVNRGEPFWIEMIKDAEILCVREQPSVDPNGNMRVTGKIWAKIDPQETQKEKRYFRLIETGTTFDDSNLEYIGTYQVFSGEIILHLFEVVFKLATTYFL